MDLGLPQRDGLEVLRLLRRRGNTTPVIILTARDEMHMSIAGLDAGADDYIVKPFDLDELMARMRSALRRAAGRGEPFIQHGDLRLDPVSHTVEHKGAPVTLSAHEFAVLEALLQRPGAVLSRTQLEDRLYGWDDQIGSNAIEVYIHGLRRKLGSDAIRTLRGCRLFRAQTMSSIRARLLIALILLAAFVSLLAATVTYRRVLHETSSLFDYQLRQMALSLRSQISLAPPSRGPAGSRAIRISSFRSGTCSARACICRGPACR